MSPTEGLVARPPVADKPRVSLSSNTTTVVVPDGSFSNRKSLARCFSRQAGFFLVPCCDSIVEALAYCQRLKPCVLIAHQSLVEKAEPVEFASLVDFGRSIQALVIVADHTPALLEHLLRIGCAGF